MTNLKSIANWEQLYMISNEGKVWSIFKDQYKLPSLNTNGYYKVTLINGELREQHTLHQLVARHFLPNPYNHKQVNHKDGNKANNHVDNLEWISHYDNVQHSLQTGLRKGWLTPEVKEACLERFFKGEQIKDIALDFPKTHENTLNRMLRVHCDKLGIRHYWDKIMKLRRKNAAIRNLEKINNKNK